MACDTANTYETIELFGLTEKDAQLPIPEDQVLTDSIICALVGAIEVMSEAAAECYEIGMGHAFIPGTGVVHGAATGLH